ncbi:CBS domain-containing protein [Paramicrobacterium agarici]|uniref:CBS domain-containing protein n=1 Tax=Paramicrobacterium agarici TaxID=630514 RepID=UPI0011502232|nr:CBS domain-containing protein [Microbacterium agarici]TQO22225.1 CBS domain protein [Microbacterium agarici]
MTLVRDVMTPAPQCVGENDTLTDAAKQLASLNVGALPICGDDKKLKGMVTDRDIVVKCIANGGDPSQTRASELAEGVPTTVSADADISDALSLMQAQRVRRLPVLDDKDLVGIISQADVALSLQSKDAGDTVSEISKNE